MQRYLEPSLSRSAIWRCLRRLSLSGRLAPDLPAQTSNTLPTPFDVMPLGFVHVNLKHLRQIKGQAEFVFVAIERMSRFANIEVLPDRKIATVTAAMKRFLTAFGYPVHTVLRKL